MTEDTAFMRRFEGIQSETSDPSVAETMRPLGKEPIAASGFETPLERIGVSTHRSSRGLPDVLWHLVAIWRK